MLDYLEEAGVRASGGAFELYRIDNRDTIREGRVPDGDPDPGESGRGEERRVRIFYNSQAKNSADSAEEIDRTGLLL